jgi:Ribbon-helix-helix protein, copG family.
MLKRTTILIDPDLLERLDRFAARAGATKTSVIAAALEAHLELNDTVPDLPFLAVGRSDHGRLSLDGRAIARREAGQRPRPEVG